jgi:K+/H+ antiporter YhaU regulatory subunit KhtT
MSYASLGANAIFNFLKREDMSMLIEGLNIFRVKAPEALIGKKLAESEIRERTECSVVAVQADGAVSINPDPQLPIHAGSELILIGTDEGEKRFLKTFAS